MSYRILVEKLHRNFNKKYITKEDIKDLIEPLKLDYYSAVKYLLTNNYIVRILRGIFYLKGIEERKLKKIDVSYKEAISEALKIKNIKNWYFGLKTALKLNNLTHEYIAIDTIISDKIFRKNIIKIFNHNIRFVKAKKDLFLSGIKREKYPYSDIEKTILDIIYFSKYNSKKNSEIKNKVNEYLESANKKKILDYSNNYSKSVTKFIEEII